MLPYTRIANEFENYTDKEVDDGLTAEQRNSIAMLNDLATLIQSIVDMLTGQIECIADQYLEIFRKEIGIVDVPFSFLFLH